MEQEVTLDSTTINIDFILKEEISELKAVTVTAGSFEAGDKKKSGYCFKFIRCIYNRRCQC